MAFRIKTSRKENKNDILFIDRDSYVNFYKF